MRIVIEGDGPPCPRCGLVTEIREHDVITDSLLQKPFYYRRWFYCTNDACETTLVMREAFKVYRDDPTMMVEASAHLREMADYLERGEPYQMFEDDPAHCAASIRSILGRLAAYQ